MPRMCRMDSPGVGADERRCCLADAIKRFREAPAQCDRAIAQVEVIDRQLTHYAYHAGQVVYWLS